MEKIEFNNETSERKEKLCVLKEKCKILAEKGTECRKEINSSSGLERYGAWNKKRSIGLDSRVHLIAYCLLRGKEYCKMESKTRTDLWTLKYISKQILTAIHENCLESEKTLWSAERIFEIMKSSMVQE
jgi:hypothetical protein